MISYSTRETNPDLIYSGPTTRVPHRYLPGIKHCEAQDVRIYLYNILFT